MNVKGFCNPKYLRGRESEFMQNQWMWRVFAIRNFCADRCSRLHAKKVLFALCKIWVGLCYSLCGSKSEFRQNQLIWRGFATRDFHAFMQKKLFARFRIRVCHQNSLRGSKSEFTLCKIWICHENSFLGVGWLYFLKV